jgi:DNA-binding transcriptional LysR family regulator
MCAEHAARTLIWPKLEAWLPQYPDINIEISSDNRFTDIVADRFDIGVRLGGDIAKDMIAVRMAPDMRMTVAGSPAYLTRRGRPATPHDLTEHDCIRQRLPTHGGRGRSVDEGSGGLGDHLPRIPPVLRQPSRIAGVDNGGGGAALPERLGW